MYLLEGLRNYKGLSGTHINTADIAEMSDIAEMHYS